MHKRDIKLVMDLVVNHTSDEHSWFQESKKSKNNPYRDYYIWRPGKGEKKGKKPPNNWTSRFSGSAWKYDPDTQEWYLHLFSEKQPDLNWDNPKVRQEVIDISNYWLELGVDGFRCDVITYISKDEGLPDGKFNPFVCGDEHFTVANKIHEYLNEVNQKSWSNYDTMIVGEAAGAKPDAVSDLVNEARNELDSAITFEDNTSIPMLLGVVLKKYNFKRLKKIIAARQARPDDEWNTLYYENHDRPRITSSFGDANSAFRKELAKMIAISYLTQKGTPYVYQGQEIGMPNTAFADDEYQDTMTLKIFKTVKKVFFPLMPIARKIMARLTRDNARTPMQWKSGTGGGFTTGGKPWLKFNPNFQDLNVALQEKTPNSVLNFYKEIIAFRKNSDIIRYGSFKMFNVKSGRILAFVREYEGKKLFVVCNLVQKTVNFNAVDMHGDGADLVISNYPTTQKKFTSGLTLRPYEAFVFSL
jgi:oligo-1,6-glucosidase